MATIEKYTGKDGITIYAAFDTQGKRIRHKMNYTPAPCHKEVTNGID